MIYIPEDAFGHPVYGIHNRPYTELEAMLHLSSLRGVPLDHEIFAQARLRYGEEKLTRFEAFIWLIVSADADGQVPMDAASAAPVWGWGKKDVETFLRELEDANEIKRDNIH